jgi:hypothetical protein
MIDLAATTERFRQMAEGQRAFAPDRLVERLRASVIGQDFAALPAALRSLLAWYDAAKRRVQMVKG